MTEGRIIIRPILTPWESESRSSTAEALALAALKAKENHRDYGLFCEGAEKPFASVSQLAWGVLYERN